MTRADMGPLRIFVGGTFDGLHLGHLYLFEFARRRGLALAKRLGRDGIHLTVTVARDDSVQRLKHRAPHHDQRERRKLVAALRAVDSAFVGAKDDFLRSVRRARPDLVVLGYDQRADWESILGKAGISARVIRCPAYGVQRLKSSRMRSDLERQPT